MVKSNAKPIHPCDYDDDLLNNQFYNTASSQTMNAKSKKLNSIKQSN